MEPNTAPCTPAPARACVGKKISANDIKMMVEATNSGWRNADVAFGDEPKATVGNIDTVVAAYTDNGDAIVAWARALLACNKADANRLLNYIMSTE